MTVVLQIRMALDSVLKCLWWLQIRICILWDLLIMHLIVTHMNLLSQSSPAPYSNNSSVKTKVKSNKCRAVVSVSASRSRDVPTPCLDKNCQRLVFMSGGWHLGLGHLRLVLKTNFRPNCVDLQTSCLSLILKFECLVRPASWYQEVRVSVSSQSGALTSLAHP